jgi:hypothetical protein
MLEISARIQPGPHDDSQADNVMFTPGRDKVSQSVMTLLRVVTPTLGYCAGMIFAENR